MSEAAPPDRHIFSDYHKPRSIWVNDGHVFTEGYDGAIMRMTPEVAIEVGRRLSDAGAESLINKVMDKTAASSVP